MHANTTPARTDDLVLESCGAGYAYVRAELDAAIADADQVDRDMARLLEHRDDQPSEPRYTLTQAGRDYLARERAMHALFGRPWPTVAQACGLEQLGAA
jgi:hypothetical protein